MNDAQYLQHCRELLADFAGDLTARTRHLPPEDPLRELALAFQAASAATDDLHAQGTALAVRLFNTYPDMAPLFPRQLLWFLGGDCLHYMPDEEIGQYQALDEMRLEAAARGDCLDLRQARAKLLNLQ